MDLQVQVHQSLQVVLEIQTDQLHQLLLLFQWLRSVQGIQLVQPDLLDQGIQFVP